jgi:ATP adenylyltransferase
MSKIEKESRSGCPFCEECVELRIIAREGTVIAIRDKFPVTYLHTLVLPRRHVSDFFDLTPEEKADADRLLLSLKDGIIKEDPSVTGFNVGVNCGATAGQTIMHAHIHLIPRRHGDILNPRGGVRGVIPAKMDYRENNGIRAT